MSLERTSALTLLEPRYTDWANRPFDRNVEQINIFKHWINANYLKRESNLVRLSLEHRTLPL